MARHAQIRKIIGEVLRARREVIGITQERLGFRAQLHRNYVGSAERGERNPSIESLARWLRVLDLDWEEFGRALDAGLSDRIRRPQS